MKDEFGRKNEEDEFLKGIKTDQDANEDPLNEKKEEKSKVEDEENEVVCPHGYELGVDYLDEDECGDCEGGPYEACMKAHKLLRRNKKK